MSCTQEIGGLNCEVANDSRGVILRVVAVGLGPGPSGRWRIAAQSEGPGLQPYDYSGSGCMYKADRWITDLKIYKLGLEAIRECIARCFCTGANCTAKYTSGEDIKAAMYNLYYPCSVVILVSVRGEDVHMPENASMSGRPIADQASSPTWNK